MRAADSGGADAGSAAWERTEVGAGAVRAAEDGIHLSIAAGSAQCYHDAQISDYALPRPRFGNRPPLRLSVRARMQGRLRGTAGFGFWNHPLAPNVRRLRVPRAIWFFFASPPNHIALAAGVGGQGWKAAVFDAQNPRFYALLPCAPLGFLLMRQRLLQRALWRVGQAALGVDEAMLDAALLDEFHSYTIDWLPGEAVFAVDGQVVLRTARTRRGALGFVAWVDNQYAVVSPQGRFGWGLLDVRRPQSLILQDLRLLRL